MTLQTMSDREDADGAARERRALFRNRSARGTFAEPRARHTSDSGDGR
jgi:hypothetical protein